MALLLGLASRSRKAFGYFTLFHDGNGSTSGLDAGNCCEGCQGLPQAPRTSAKAVKSSQ